MNKTYLPFYCVFCMENFERFIDMVEHKKICDKKEDKEK